MVSPYTPNSDWQEEKLTKHHVVIASRCLSGNRKTTPDDMMQWLATETGKIDPVMWSNLQVVVYTDPGDDCNLEQEYIQIRGDRLETDEEHARRLRSILSKFRREREEFVQKARFYQTGKGRAVLDLIEQDLTGVPQVD